MIREYIFESKKNDFYILYFHGNEFLVKLFTSYFI